MEEDKLQPETAEQSNNRPWLYKKGQSGNPSGRPKGSKSMKQWIKDKLATMTEEERETFLEGLPKDKIWEMAEGRATGTDITINTEKNNLSPEQQEKINKAIDEVI